MLIITWDTKLKSESVEKKNQSSKELPYQWGKLKAPNCKKEV